MKAITVTFKGWTETRPSRFLVKAEGVKTKVYPASTYTEYIAAKCFARDHGWLNDGSRLIAGTLPNRDAVYVIHKDNE